jgi:hypothetical protein
MMRTNAETEYLSGIEGRHRHLRSFLQERAPPTHETTPPEWHRLLSTMKAIVGNASNDMSFIAALLAKAYLCQALPMRDFDVALKPQGAPGLDIDELTADGRRVVAEIKTTTPYAGTDLGAQQEAMFAKDFVKLNGALADLKFFFLTDRTAFDLMRRKYHLRIPAVTVVLLPEGEVLPPLASAAADG